MQVVFNIVGIVVAKISKQKCCLAALMGLVSTSSYGALTHLSIEQLMEVEIYSVGKKEESGNKAAAAVHVITQEDIKHSGVTSIPEALRLAPGVFVGRIDSNKWSVGIRGGVGRFSNKLLVMIDGRSIYTPVFSGVYWENHDLVLDDIKQIEVIRGPGATVWGANAVNGVINIITKSSKDTQGVLINAGTGNVENGFVDVRYGGSIADSFTYRLFAKTFDRDEFRLRDGRDANDDWNRDQIGFRMDWEGEDSKLMITGDAYDNDMTSIDSFPYPVSPYLYDFDNIIDAGGWHLMTKWDDTINENHSYSVQVFYDTYHRSELLVGQKIKTMDFDAVYNWILNPTHHLTMGVGARRQSGIIENRIFTTMRDPERNLHLYSGFIQDDITVTEDVVLTLGTKIEHNDFTGYEVQPSARIAWAPADAPIWWASISRAVRTPGRNESSVSILSRVQPPGAIPLTGLAYFYGQDLYTSEELVAYEGGVRYQPLPEWYFDFSVFYNDYKDIRTVEQQPPVINFANLTATVLGLIENQARGYSTGAELFVQYQPTDWIDMKLTYSHIQQDYEVDSTSNYTGYRQLENDTPENSVSFLTKLKPHERFDFDIWFRYVDAIGWSGLSSPFAGPLEHYVTLDLQAIYRPMDHVELSLVGQNLMEYHRVEAIQLFNSYPTEVPRSVYAKVSLKFD